MTGKKRSIGSDLQAGDADTLLKQDYKEIWELTEADFKRGIWHRTGKPMPHGARGRPKSKNPKRPVSLRVDADVLAHFRRSGRGWQSRINAILRKAAKLPEHKRRKA